MWLSKWSLDNHFLLNTHCSLLKGCFIDIHLNTKYTYITNEWTVVAKFEGKLPLRKLEYRKSAVWCFRRRSWKCSTHLSTNLYSCMYAWNSSNSASISTSNLAVLSCPLSLYRLFWIHTKKLKSKSIFPIFTVT